MAIQSLFMINFRLFYGYIVSLYDYVVYFMVIIF